MRKYSSALIFIFFVLITSFSSILASAQETKLFSNNFKSYSDRVFNEIMVHSNNNESLELYYDDGVADFGFIAWPRAVAAVKFSVSEVSKILKLKYFVWGNMSTIRVLVLDKHLNILFFKDVMPYSGWFEVDISSTNVIVSEDFFVALEWPFGGQPWLGVDNSPPHHNRSYLGSLNSLGDPKSGENYMIRVVIKKSMQVFPVFYTSTDDGIIRIFLNGSKQHLLPISSTRAMGILENKLYIGQGKKISVYTTEGVFLRNISIPSVASSYISLVVLPNERIALLDNANDKVYFIDFSGNFITSVKILDTPDNHLQNLHGIVVNDTLVLSEDGNGHILKIDLSTYKKTIFKDLSGKDAWLGAIYYSDGYYYVCGPSSIFRFSENTDAVRIANIPDYNIVGIVVIGDYAYIAVNFGGKIYRVDLKNKKSEIFVSDLKYPRRLLAITYSSEIRRQNIISCQLSQTEVTKLSTLTISGSINPSPGYQVPIVAIFTSPTGEIKKVTSLTDSNGNYKILFIPDVKGSWQVYVMWEGDKGFLPSKSKEVPFIVYPIMYIFKIDSNVRSENVFIEVNNNFVPTSNLPEEYKAEEYTILKVRVDSESYESKVERYIFEGWEDGGKELYRLFTIDRNIEIMAIFRKQYYLKVKSDIGNVEGEGWYDDGSLAKVSVLNTIISGNTGERFIFMGWSGDILSDSTSVSIIVDKPKTIYANWKKQYYVKVYSEYNSFDSGNNWYDEGLYVRLKLRGTSLGFLIKDVFDHFEGLSPNDKVIGNGEVEIFIDNPRNIVAVWRKDYTQLILLVFFVTIGAITSISLINRKKIIKERKEEKIRTKVISTNIEKLKEEISKYENYLSKLEEVRSKGLISEKVYETLKKEYESNIERIKKEIEKLIK